MDILEFVVGTFIMKDLENLILEELRFLSYELIERVSLINLLVTALGPTPSRVLRPRVRINIL